MMDQDSRYVCTGFEGGMGIQELSIIRPKSSKNKEFNLSMHHLLHQMFKVYGKKPFTGKSLVYRKKPFLKYTGESLDVVTFQSASFPEYLMISFQIKGQKIKQIHKNSNLTQ